METILQDPKASQNYTVLVKHAMLKEITHVSVEPIPIKKLSYKNEIPVARWTESEGRRMNIIENLQYAVISKFSYGWLELEDLCKQIPKQCGIKGECLIGLLRNRHILMRFELIEEFLNIITKSVYYIKASDGNFYQMRPLIYDSKTKMEEEYHNLDIFP